MAWVTQTFSGDGIIAALGDKRVVISAESLGSPGIILDNDGILTIEPVTQDQAHALALIFRSIARRLEEIGKDLQ